MNRNQILPRFMIIGGLLGLANGSNYGNYIGGFIMGSFVGLLLGLAVLMATKDQADEGDEEKEKDDRHQ